MPLFVYLHPDSVGLPRGAARRRVAAPAQGDPEPAPLRDGLRGLPQAPLPHHQGWVGLQWTEVVNFTIELTHFDSDFMSPLYSIVD